MHRTSNESRLYILFVGLIRLELQDSCNCAYISLQSISKMFLLHRGPYTEFWFFLCCRTLLLSCKRPSAHVDIRMFVLAVMEWVDKCHVFERYDHLVRPVRAVLVDCLVAQYNEEQKGGISSHEWWREYSRRASFSLLPEHFTVISELLNVRTKEFRDQLDRLNVAVASGPLGAAMFTWALPKAIDDHMAHFIHQLLQYPKDRLLTKQDIIDWERLIQEEGARVFQPKACLLP